MRFIARVSRRVLHFILSDVQYYRINCVNTTRSSFQTHNKNTSVRKYHEVISCVNLNERDFPPRIPAQNNLIYHSFVCTSDTLKQADGRQNMLLRTPHERYHPEMIISKFILNQIKRGVDRFVSAHRLLQHAASQRAQSTSGHRTTESTLTS